MCMNQDKTTPNILKRNKCVIRLQNNTAVPWVCHVILKQIYLFLDLENKDLAITPICGSFQVASMAFKTDLFTEAWLFDTQHAPWGQVLWKNSDPHPIECRDTEGTPGVVVM